MEEYIIYLCSKQGIPVSKLEQDLGFGNGYIRSAKKRGITLERVCMISEYLKVPIWKFSDTIKNQRESEIAYYKEQIAFLNEQLDKARKTIQEKNGKIDRLLAGQRG